MVYYCIEPRPFFFDWKLNILSRKLILSMYKESNILFYSSYILSIKSTFNSLINLLIFVIFCLYEHL